MKKVYISDLKGMISERIEESFFLADVTESGHADNRWLSLILCDRTGRSFGKVWGEYIMPEYLSYKGQVVKVSGIVECFRGQTGIKVETIKPVNEAEMSDYVLLPNPEVVSDQLVELEWFISRIENKSYKALLKKIFTPARLKKFSQMPASTDLYASYSGGWITNTLTGVRLCSALSEAERDFATGAVIDTDLLITGALLRDVGKISAFDESLIDWKLSPRAFLVGCAVDGCTFVQASNQQLGEQRVEDLTDLLHVISSCHGSDIKPRTKEALIVSMADRMAAASAAYDTAVNDSRKQDGGDMAYSSYLKYDVVRRRQKDAGVNKQ